MKQSWIIAIALAFVAACLCGLLAALAIGGAAFFGWITTSSISEATPEPSAIPETSAHPTKTPMPTSDPLASATTAVSMSDEIEAQMDEIQEQVIALRGLRLSDPVDRDLLSEAALRQRVTDDFLADYSPEEAQQDARTLSLFGMLAPDFDLMDLYLELYSEQVAGYYDSEAEQMFVVANEAFGGIERLTYSHEFTHVLQDQTYDMEQGLGMTEDACELDSERCAAITAVLEGDATMAEEQWLRTYATADDLEEIMDFYAAFESPVFDSAPQFLQEDFIFPYTFGTRFVRQAYADQGWASVDALYDNPPLSTEQILHPERYPRDVPLILDLPDLGATLGGGWQEIDAGVWGEWFTRLMLAERIDEKTAETAAAGWGGDRDLAYFNETLGQGALILFSAWDRPLDATEFSDAFEAYALERFGEGELERGFGTWETGTEFVRFEHAAGQTLWILAPDAETGALIRDAIKFPIPLEQDE